MNIKKVLILGGGTMGQQIAALCAIGGCEVVVYDVAAGRFDELRDRLRRLLSFCESAGKLQPGRAEQLAEQIRYTADPAEAAAEADLVSESVPEDPELKGRVFAQFHALCPERTIFTTNTSLLRPSTYAAATGRPEKFLAFHFHDLRATPLVDIMPHPGTAPETVELVKAFAYRIKQIPIVMTKESPGYLFNAMLSSVLGTAQALAANQVASIEDIDRAWMVATGMKVGPFGSIDSIGLDLVWKIGDARSQKTQEPQDLKNSAFMRSYVERGELGEKTGKGFYTYPNPAYAAPGFAEGKGQT